ncbi:response regulator transcription factor [uncultured Sphingomonas sp.]|uniref:response regulator transcription factor n=1 Tax=uncultured Sphingomonas sp. TaxID=158754 RepID=UPI002630F10D|nr:response regulator transcription factor [uncultured Sphingomonas sp.]
MAAEPLLFVVEDDSAFAHTLGRSFERRGYRVALAADPVELEALLATQTPDFAVVDLKLGNASGLACVQTLHEQDPDTVIVVLTGYASIATAVQAIKLGATSYLAKPADTDDIEAAFGMVAGDVNAPISERKTTIKTLEWERIHKTLAASDFNVSETARRLGMHRRTLARKLEKRPLR